MYFILNKLNYKVWALMSRWECFERWFPVENGPFLGRPSVLTWSSGNTWLRITHQNRDKKYHSLISSWIHVGIRRKLDQCLFMCSYICERKFLRVKLRVGHFAERLFSVRKFRRMDILPWEHFIVWTFHCRTYCHTDISPCDVLS